MKTEAAQFVLTIEVPVQKAEGLAQLLAEEWDIQPVILEKPNHQQAWLELYFSTAAEAENVRKVMAKRAGVRGTQVRRCDPRDWLNFWKHHFKPQDIGASLRICPVWEKAGERRTARKMVLVDPGASFGTGEHFTTRFCLEMIDRLCQKSALRSLVDVGTGSGILAIAAAKLGCRKVLGIDNDALALRQARRNVSLNRATGRVKLRVQDIVTSPLSEKFDVVCANIISGVLVDVAPKLMRCAGKRVILSGIREMEADGVADAYMALGGREIVRDGDGEWAGMMLDVERK